MARLEVVVKAVDSPGTKRSRDREGDVICVVSTPDMAAKRADLLSRAARHDAAGNTAKGDDYRTRAARFLDDSGEPTWPWSEKERSEFAIVVTDDMDPVTINKCHRKETRMDLSAQFSAREMADFRNPGKPVNPMRHKPVPAREYTDRPER